LKNAVPTLAVWQKNVISRALARMIENQESYVIAVSFNIFQLICIIMPSIWATNKNCMKGEREHGNL